MSREKERLGQNVVLNPWKKWGPYTTDRQWGTVREDYSENGDAWNYMTHDMARSKAYRWGEEGIGGISDDKQLLCFAIGLWNKKDPIIKERYFGIVKEETNHGEDVKELYYYIDSTPTHSYMKMLYKYPQAAYPYEQLIDVNSKRSKEEPEFELIDTGIFNEDKYFDVFIEYAKASEEDMLIKITVCNRGKEDASLHILPQLWFRNTWALGYDDYKPQLNSDANGNVIVEHEKLGKFYFYASEKTQLLFCDNETNIQKLYGANNTTEFVKDGVNEYLVNKNEKAVHNSGPSTKVALNYDVTIKGGEQKIVKFRLCKTEQNAFESFDAVFNERVTDANDFYNELQTGMDNDDAKMIQRQAFAGMLWNKQFYYYDLYKWLNGDPAQPKPPQSRLNGRNNDWKNIHTENIISMPDKWEYPWFAAWDLAFHCVTYAVIDAQFAKEQLYLLTTDWYMHPNGRLPSCEWSFDDPNPPLHAWAAWRVYKIEEKHNGNKDTIFLETIFHKLLLNFGWWVNKKDKEGKNIFEGGFLGLDNISVFDKNAVPDNVLIQQTDGTSWMAMYALNMMRIALELALTNIIYQDMATKFFEHFLYIAEAMSSVDEKKQGLWDDEDEFFYDLLKLPDGEKQNLKLRTLVGLTPLLAVEIIDDDVLKKLPQFANRLKWFLKERSDLANLVSRWENANEGERHLLSLLRGHRMKKLLQRMLDENEFLGAYGVRSLSKVYQKHPYQLDIKGYQFDVHYAPGEDVTGILGGNSNWRGPIWFPFNFLFIESLERFHHYYGDDFKIECPTGSGNYCTLNDVAEILKSRLAQLFLRDKNGQRPFNGEHEKLQTDSNFKDYILFYEHFHGDTGRGLGAAHQTGWTGLIAKLLMKE